MPVAKCIEVDEAVMKSNSPFLLAEITSVMKGYEAALPSFK